MEIKFVIEIDLSILWTIIESNIDSLDLDIRNSRSTHEYQTNHYDQRYSNVLTNKNSSKQNDNHIGISSIELSLLFFEQHWSMLCFYHNSRLF